MKKQKEIALDYIKTSDKLKSENEDYMIDTKVSMQEKHTKLE